jgi:membrane-bound metal-dependent hydrolase YbcI (DUF457 family)
MIPLFVIYRKKAIPYYAALLSHVLVGDFVTGGVELFWPLSHNLFGALNFDVTSLTIALTELILFLITLPLMYKLGDLKTLFKPHNRNWALIIPFGAVLGPLLRAGAGEESSLPILLVVPSLIYIGLFSYSMFIWLRAWHKKNESGQLLRIKSQSSFVVQSDDRINQTISKQHLLSRIAYLRKGTYIKHLRFPKH